LAGQDGAIAAFDRSLALDPSSVTTLGQRGLAKLQTGDLAGAEADARAAADADPRFAAWWWTLSLALAEQGRYDEAEQAVSAGIDATGGTLSLFEERAEVRLALGDCAGARADLAEMERRGAAVDPDLVEQTRSLCSSGAGGSD
jgi:small glutamine-rich tetratricopeptide repeat-containing protein alpha